MWRLCRPSSGAAALESSLTLLVKVQRASYASHEALSSAPPGVGGEAYFFTNVQRFEGAGRPECSHIWAETVRSEAHATSIQQFTSLPFSAQQIRWYAKARPLPQGKAATRPPSKPAARSPPQGKAAGKAPAKGKAPVSRQDAATPTPKAAPQPQAGVSVPSAEASLRQARQTAAQNMAGTSGQGGAPGSSGQAGEEVAKRKEKGFAQQSAAMMQPRRLQMAAISPNLIAEPYRGDKPPIPWGAYLGSAGWKERWARFMGGVRFFYTLAKCRKHLGTDSKGFKKDAIKLYTDINRMTAAGDRTGLRHLITPGEMSNVKNQLKMREESNWRRVDWSLGRELQPHHISIVHGRLMAMDPKNEEMTFAQLTILVKAMHKFAVYDERGNIVAGSPDQEIPVQDVWVLERSFQKAAHSKWRLAGRISGVPLSSRRSWWRGSAA